MNILIVGGLITVTRNPQLFIEITMSQHTKNLGSKPSSQTTGQVLRLTTDWKKLLDTLSNLQISAITYRNDHAILCRRTQFPELHWDNDKAYESSGYTGSMFNTELWSEAWSYEEYRLGKFFPCLEVADHYGRGIFKLSYNQPEAPTQDIKAIHDLAEGEADLWDIIHLRRSNTLSVPDPKFRSGKYRSSFHNLLDRIFAEAAELSIELGIIISSEEMKAWDSVQPMICNSHSGWLSTGSSNTSLHLSPSGYCHAEITHSCGRNLIILSDAKKSSSLTIIEPANVKLRSFNIMSNWIKKYNRGIS